jgi:hypothetical protein
MKKNKLHSTSSILSNASLKSNPFKVPENYFNTVEALTIAKLKAEIIQKNNTSEITNNYFETLEDAVMAKIDKKPKVISLKTIVKYVTPLAIAASILLVFVLNTNQKNVTFESLATAEIEQFIESGLIDISTVTLAETFTDIDLTNYNLVPTISDDEVVNYLTNEDLETIFYEN